MNKKTKRSGIGLVSALTILFVILKLLGVIEWSWLWVLSPIWISIVLAVIIFVAVLVIGRIKKGKW